MRKFIVILILLSILIMPMPVSAATDTLTVSGDGSDTPSGTYTGGAGTFANLNSDDGNTSYWSRTDVFDADPSYRSWNYTNSVVTGDINSATIYFKVEDDQAGLGGYQFTPYVLISGTRYYGDMTAPLSEGTYVTLSKTWAVNPSTGVAWTLAQVNAAEFGFRYKVYSSGGGDAIRCTYSYLSIDYNPLTAPSVTTDAADDLAPTSATLNGTITSDGGATITNYGFVWGNETRADPGNTAPSASAYDSNYEIGAGSYAEGSFSRATGATLVSGTTYWYRFAALNSEGWSYGDEQTFTTIEVADGNTSAATNVASTTAQLNAEITDDGGEACDIQFGWDTASHALFADYPNKSTLETDTYITGSFPSATATGLTTSTLYHFRVNITNAAGSTLGDDLTFTTESGVSEPSSIKAVPTDTTISLLWVKGTGSASTLVRYSTGSYPASVNHGTLAYLGTGSSCTISGLTPGTTYYIRSWGYTGGVYSADPESVMTTTLAYGTATTTTRTPPTNDSWDQLPDSSFAVNIPWISTLLQENIADQYEIPITTAWYTFWLFGCVGAGVVSYSKRQNIALTLFIEVLILGLGAAMGLMMLWILFALCMAALGFVFFGERR